MPNFWNHSSFVNISLTLVIDTSMKTLSRVLEHGNKKYYLKKNTCLSVSAVIFGKQFLADAVHIDESAFLSNP